MTYPGCRGSESERFWKRVTILENGCWQWTGGKSNGYGMFHKQRTEHGKQAVHKNSHVWAYENYVGPIPERFELDHLCRNRACVNPLHLEPVPKAVNVLRGEGACAKHARKSHCKHGHKLEGNNLAFETDSKGRISRRCRECVRLMLERRKLQRRLKKLQQALPQAA